MFFSFLETEWNVIGHLSKTFRPVCQNCVLRVHGNNWGKLFLLKQLFVSFPDLGQRFVPVWQEVSLSILSKFYSTCTKNVLGVFLKQFFYYFSTLSEKVSTPLYRKFYSGVSKKWFCVSIGAFWEFLKRSYRFHLFRILSKSFQARRKNLFRPGCRNCMLGL